MGLVDRLAIILQRHGLLPQHHSVDRRIKHFDRQLCASHARGNVLLQDGRMATADDVERLRKRLFAKA
jgi:hypothetical protein